MHVVPATYGWHCYDLNPESERISLWSQCVVCIRYVSILGGVSAPQSPRARTKFRVIGSYSQVALRRQTADEDVLLLVSRYTGKTTRFSAFSVICEYASVDVKKDLFYFDMILVLLLV